MERGHRDTGRAVDGSPTVSRRTALHLGAGAAAGLFAPVVVRGAEQAVIRNWPDRGR